MGYLPCTAVARVLARVGLAGSDSRVVSVNSAAAAAALAVAILLRTLLLAVVLVVVMPPATVAVVELGAVGMLAPLVLRATISVAVKAAVEAAGILATDLLVALVGHRAAAVEGAAAD